ncbi:hypothetical protein RJ641_006213, partial [Dillenia turbinata]
MAASEKELQEQLLVAGNKLLQHPTSVDELLPLLDKVEGYLSRVEQSPSKAMQNALSPSMNALVTDKFLRHLDADVRISVASCISEITRITAPEAPYDDDQMKEIFKLIVSSFEHLSERSSRSYHKRTLILETVAKVRSCVVMLDLECDALILEMFQHFFNAIRDYHPENVFSSMETIMSLVLEESEDISLELLSPILASVKKDNKEVQPIARKLGEKVLENCASKLKPCLLQAVKTSDISLADYSNVVASICNELSGSVEHTDANAPAESVVGKERASNAVAEAQCPVEKDLATNRSPKSVMSNGVTQAGKDGLAMEADVSKKTEPDHPVSQSKASNVSIKDEPHAIDSEEVIKSKSEQTTKRRGKKSSSLKNSREPSDSSRIDGEKDAGRQPEHSKIRAKEIEDTLPEISSAKETDGHSENEKEAGKQVAVPEALETESSPTTGGNVPEESHSKMGGRGKKKESLVKDATASSNVVSKRVPDGKGGSELKRQKGSGKKGLLSSNDGDTSQPTFDATSKEDGTANDGDDELLDESIKVDASNKEEKSSIKQKRGRGKPTLAKGATKSSASDDTKDEVSTPKTTEKSGKDKPQLEETLKTNSKRKRTLGKEQASDGKDLGENLVGSKGQATDGPSLDPSSDMHQKKKIKTYSDSSSKHGKMDVSPKGSRASSSGKAKSTAPKSGRKTNDDSKLDRKSKDDNSKSVGKVEPSHSAKTKDDTTKSGGRSMDDASKSAGKSKVDHGSISKPGKRSKQVTPKNVSKSKRKAPQSGSRTSENGVEKVKGSSDVKETENMSTKSLYSEKDPDNEKLKSPELAKTLESEGKAAKKGRKG